MNAKEMDPMLCVKLYTDTRPPPMGREEGRGGVLEKASKNTKNRRVDRMNGKRNLEECSTSNNKGRKTLKTILLLITKFRTVHYAMPS